MRRVLQVISTGFYDQLEVNKEESWPPASSLVWEAGWLTVPFTKIRKYGFFFFPEALADLLVILSFRASESLREILPQ